MPKKSDEIKVRVDPLSKLALQQIADEDQIVLSDVARRAFRLYIKHRTTTPQQPFLQVST